MGVVDPAYLDVLSDSVEKYEDEHYPIQRVSGIDALRHLVQLSDKTQATVAAEAELPESTLSEVLLGRRRLNTRHIGIRGCRDFRIDPGEISARGSGPVATSVSHPSSRCTSFNLAAMSISCEQVGRQSPQPTQDVPFRVKAAYSLRARSRS